MEVQQEKRIVRRKLANEVLDRLMELLRTGQYAPGDRLPSEKELMERYGVGRQAVREALQSAAQLGLITIRHGERAQVATPSAESLLEQIDAAARHILSSQPATLEHLKEARMLFEVAVVREAAERAAPEDVARLKDALERIRACSGRPVEFFSADMEFHKVLAAILRNPILSAVSDAMLNWIAQFHTELLYQQGRDQRVLAEHGEILSAIAAHDPAAAMQAMRDHLRRSRDLFQSPKPTQRDRTG